MEPFICGSCIKINTEFCPFKDKVFETTYVEFGNHRLTNDEKKEDWIYCKEYYD